MIKKGIFVLIAFAMMATPAFGDQRPEFDAVGCDSDNLFIGFVEDMVTANALSNDYVPVAIENFSDFRIAGYVDHPSFTGAEGFHVEGGGPLGRDLCFGNLSNMYESVLTTPHNYSVYTYDIVLQMAPASDIDVDIRDCIMKAQGADIMTEAEQTGWYTDDQLWRLWVRSANPYVTVEALPGPFANPVWRDWGSYPFKLKARRMPGLCPFDLDNVYYTSKAFWEEGLVAMRPETGDWDADGKMMWKLRRGDIIRVTITIPPHNMADIRYGSDNVLLRYIGEVNTEVYTDALSACCGSGTCPK